MTDFTDRIERALSERSECGPVSPIALAALNRIVRQSMRRQFDAWVNQVGADRARAMWVDHFGDIEVPE